MYNKIQKSRGFQSKNAMQNNTDRPKAEHTQLEIWHLPKFDLCNSKGKQDYFMCFRGEQFKF